MPDSNIQNSPAHFVPLSAIMDQYAGQLLDYMQEHEARNVVITLQVKIDIAGKKKQPFFVAVGVTFDFETPEALVDEAQRQCPHLHDCLLHGYPRISMAVRILASQLTKLVLGKICRRALLAR